MDWLNLIVFENDNIVCILLVMTTNSLGNFNLKKNGLFVFKFDLIYIYVIYNSQKYNY